MAGRFAELPVKVESVLSCTVESVVFPGLTRDLELNPNEMPNVGIEAVQMLSLLWDMELTN